MFGNRAVVAVPVRRRPEVVALKERPVVLIAESGDMAYLREETVERLGWE